MHPSDDIRGSKGKDLQGKKIVIGVTGSIAAVECVKLIRELIREGAEVYPVMSEWGTKIVHPNSLEFASGNEPITELTGMVEHVDLCGEVPDKADLFLISPATANTVSKIANGIDDTPVTTFATTSIGSDIPLVVVPAMHKSMYDHPVVMDNLQALQEELEVTVIGPKLEEGTAKAGSNEQIVDNVIRKVNLSDQASSIDRLTVVTGRTQEPIDSMRVLTNRASGRSGLELAKRAYREGIDVELWHGKMDDDVPDWIPSRPFETLGDLLSMADDLDGPVIVPAALSDFTVEKRDKKISSSEDVTLELESAPKFIDRISDEVRYLVAYKAEDTKGDAVEAAEEMIEEGRADMVIANSLSDVKADENTVYISTAEEWIQGSKREIAERIIEKLENEIG